MKRDGLIIIISGPSGAGEDSIIHGLMGEMDIELVVTTTTRPPRDSESEGHPYYFVTKEDFENSVRENKFFEFAKHYNGNYYGVTLGEIERVMSLGSVGIWKIDYKGVASAKNLMPKIKAIYIGAPLYILEERIRTRDNVTDEYVEERMNYTREWLEHLDLYDYRIINEQGKLAESIEKAKNIINRIITIDKHIKNGDKPRSTAGGIVISLSGKLCLTNNNGHSWTFPKGGVDNGEKIEGAARREIAEETGIDQLTLVQYLGDYYRLGGKSDEIFKQIMMYLYTTKETKLNPTDADNPEASWFTFSEAIEMLSFDEDRFFLYRLKSKLLDMGVVE